MELPSSSCPENEEEAVGKPIAPWDARLQGAHLTENLFITNHQRPSSALGGPFHFFHHEGLVSFIIDFRPHRRQNVTYC
jgi:hypothetical protein